MRKQTPRNQCPFEAETLSHWPDVTPDWEELARAADLDNWDVSLDWDDMAERAQWPENFLEWSE